MLTTTDLSKTLNQDDSRFWTDHQSIKAPAIQWILFIFLNQDILEQIRLSQIEYVF